MQVLVGLELKRKGAIDIMSERLDVGGNGMRMSPQSWGRRKSHRYG